MRNPNRNTVVSFRQSILIVLLLPLLIQSVLPCCLCLVVTTSQSLANNQACCTCSQCPASTGDHSSMPADRQSEKSSCPFCLGAVADTSQTMSQPPSPYDSLSVRFDLIGGSGQLCGDVPCCNSKKLHLRPCEFGMRLLI